MDSRLIRSDGPPRFAFLQNLWDDNLGPMYLSSSLKAAGFESKIFIEERGWERELADFAPSVVAFSVTTGMHHWARRVGARLREELPSKPLILWGGPHTTYYPQAIDDPHLDLVCMGEGEGAVVDLARSLEARDGRTDIANLHYSIDGKTIKNEMRELIHPLSDLPPPDREFYARYRMMSKGRKNYRNAITGRGCPYKCTFCFNPSLMDMYSGNGRFIRRRDIDEVLRELVEVRDQWGVGSFRFVDDLFTLNRRWLYDFLPAYKKEVGVPFTCNVRADVFGEEIVALLAEAGCRMVLFGIESGNEELRNNILKKKLSNEAIVSCTREVKRHGMEVTTYNMIGSPGETVDMAFETIRLNAEIKADYPWCSLTTLYPGTGVYDEAVEAGILEQDSTQVDEIGPTYFKGLAPGTPDGDQLLNLHRFFFLGVKFPWLEPVIRRLIKLRPNMIFEGIFLASYAFITLRRSRMGLRRLAAIGVRSLWMFRPTQKQRPGAVAHHPQVDGPVT